MLFQSIPPSSYPPARGVALKQAFLIYSTLILLAIALTFLSIADAHPVHKQWQVRSIQHRLNLAREDKDLANLRWSVVLANFADAFGSQDCPSHEPMALQSGRTSFKMQISSGEDLSSSDEMEYIYQAMDQWVKDQDWDYDQIMKRDAPAIGCAFEFCKQAKEEDEQDDVVLDQRRKRPRHVAFYCMVHEDNYFTRQ